jgi:agmatine/peptidylarginine deiminase
MGWPESEDSKYLWREGGEPARQAYANVAKAISQFEPLFMIANPGEPAANARKVFEDSPNVTVVEVPINDGWTRDWGPSVSLPVSVIVPVPLQIQSVSQIIACKCYCRGGAHR